MGWFNPFSKKKKDILDEKNTLVDKVDKSRDQDEATLKSEETVSEELEAPEVSSVASATPVKEKKTKKFGWGKIFSFKKIDAEVLDDLEDELILADFGGKTSVEIMQAIRGKVEEEKIKDPELVRGLLKEKIKSYFSSEIRSFKEGKTPVICFIGINGVGKTTTLAKVAHYFREEYQIIIGAADTYRAAATLQLDEWAKRLNLPIVNKGEQADAAAVAFDTIESALAKDRGMALIDTAGRLHNKQNLIDQLNKLIRICDRFEDKIDRKNFLVLDATLGQIGFDQVKVFLEQVGVDGIILTKLDTQSKGGVIVSISEAFKLPIYFMTYGEQMDQIKPFELDEYVDSII